MTNEELLKEHMAKLKTAKEDMKSVLASIFPKGARVGVLLMHGQKTETLATVFGHQADPPRILVTIDTAKPDSRYRVRAIPPSAATLF